MEDKITVDLKEYNGLGNAIDGTTAELTRDQISAIVDVAAEISLARRDGRGRDAETLLMHMDELLSASGIIEAPRQTPAPKI